MTSEVHSCRQPICPPLSRGSRPAARPRAARRRGAALRRCAARRARSPRWARRSRSPAARRPSRRRRRGAAVAPGVDVAALQRALGVTADGVLRAADAPAVRRFQRAQRAHRRRRRRAADARRARPERTAGAPAVVAGVRCSSGSPRASRAATRPPSRPTAATAASTSSRAPPGARMGGTGDPAKAPEAEQDRLRRRAPRGRAAPRPGPTAPERRAGTRRGAAPAPSASSQRSRCGVAHPQRRAGAPATTALAGTSLVTTVFVPTMQLSPTVTPRRMHAP